jgi:DNA-binding MarR family transcriptional regulator
MNAPKPLGYWLQHLHSLLETHFPLVLSDLGTNRREWQLLNTLAQGSRNRGDLEQALAPFWTADQPSLRHVLATLADRGWVEESNGTVTLSPAGVAVHAELAPRVERARAVVLKGLTPNQYQETIRILSAMAGNVEAAIASHATATEVAA